MRKVKKDTSLRDLILGILFFCIGVYIIFQHTYVVSSWGFYLGRVHVSSGMVILPLLIGIIWKVLYPESMTPWLLIGLAILFILVSIMLGVRIYFIRTSLFDYILMFGLTAIGLGLLIKSLFLSAPVKSKK